MSTKATLLPCPFCGSPAYMTSEAGDPFDDIGRFHFVKCSKCRARGGDKYAPNGNDCPQFYAEVCDEWNQRQPVNQN